MTHSGGHQKINNNIITNHPPRWRFETTNLASRGQVVRVVRRQHDPGEKDRHDPRQLHRLCKRVTPVARQEKQRDLELGVVADARVLEQEGAGQTDEDPHRSRRDGDGEEAPEGGREGPRCEGFVLLVFP